MTLSYFYSNEIPESEKLLQKVMNLDIIKNFEVHAIDLRSSSFTS